MLARITTQLGDVARPLTSDPDDCSSVTSSASTAWAGLPFDVLSVRSAEGFNLTTPPEGEHGLLVVLDGDAELVFDGDDGGRRSATRGSVSFLSGDDRRVAVEMTGSLDVAVVQMPHEWFERALLAGPPEGFGRAEPLEQDETLESIVQTMRREVVAGAPTGRLFAESLSLALVTYAVECVPPSKLRVRGGLSEEQCRRIRGYIRDRLHQELSLVELSSLVGLRPRQFSTLFRRAFGTTAHRYIIGQRVAGGRTDAGQRGRQPRRHRAPYRLLQPEPLHRRVPAGVRRDARPLRRRASQVHAAAPAAQPPRRLRATTLSSRMGFTPSKIGSTCASIT